MTDIHFAFRLQDLSVPLMDSIHIDGSSKYHGGNCKIATTCRGNSQVPMSRFQYIADLMGELTGFWDGIPRRPYSAIKNTRYLTKTTNCKLLGWLTELLVSLFFLVYCTTYSKN
ncbi:hypothetical protein GE061_004260 [Apolygus lucorum]|uniref:Uncharacterized protein n=1 Tax=Apolygus lucorum TaxID=248454 RepID=A0A8S9X062_APOLU|nr:hypothetical protein GE061_004260 [Apolygus lucorum]